MFLDTLPDCLLMILPLVWMLRAIFAFSQSPKRPKDVAVLIVKLVLAVIKIALNVVV